MQTCLEKKGIDSRNETIVRNDYNKADVYSETHKDALSDGDVLGKGTKHGGHTHSLPDCTKPKGQIDYSDFDTTNGGGYYDIHGRNDIGGRLKAINSSLYNAENQYGPSLVNTEKNLADGQIQIW